MYVCLCTSCLTGACGGQKRELGPWKLEFTDVCELLGMWLELNMAALLLLSHLSSPCFCFLIFSMTNYFLSGSFQWNFFSNVRIHTLNYF